MEKKLYRSANDRAVLGICGGIGEYLDIDPIIVRLIVVILTLLGFSGLLFYIVAIFVIPENPVYQARREGRYYEADWKYAENSSGSASSTTENSSGGTARSGEQVQYEVGPDGQVREREPKQYHYEVQNRRRSGNGALLLGFLLIAAGIFVLLRIFMPWIDQRLFMALILIVLGLVMILRR